MNEDTITESCKLLALQQIPPDSEIVILLCGILTHSDDLSPALKYAAYCLSNSYSAKISDTELPCDISIFYPLLFNKIYEVRSSVYQILGNYNYEGTECRLLFQIVIQGLLLETDSNVLTLCLKLVHKLIDHVPEAFVQKLMNDVIPFCECIRPRSYDFMYIHQFDARNAESPEHAYSFVLYNSASDQSSFSSLNYRYFLRFRYICKAIKILLKVSSIIEASKSITYSRR